MLVLIVISNVILTINSLRVAEIFDVTFFHLFLILRCVGLGSLNVCILFLFILFFCICRRIILTHISAFTFLLNCILVWVLNILLNLYCIIFTYSIIIFKFNYFTVIHINNFSIVSAPRLGLLCMICIQFKVVFIKLNVTLTWWTIFWLIRLTLSFSLF